MADATQTTPRRGPLPGKPWIASGLILAAIAAWARVGPRVFAAYPGFAVAGAVLAGLRWQMAA